MRRRNSAINAIQSLYDENVELKQKIEVLTSGSKQPRPDGDKTFNSFAVKMYELGFDHVKSKLKSHLKTRVDKNKDGSYHTYEQWLESMFESRYDDPFNNYDTRFLLDDFSRKELLELLEPWLRSEYKRLAENQRLSDIKPTE